MVWADGVRCLPHLKDLHPMWRTLVLSPVVAARTLLLGMGLRNLVLRAGLKRTGSVGTPAHGVGTKDGT